jgi:hypothetical protein
MAGASVKAKVYQLAARYGASVSEGVEEVTAELPGNKRWESSETGILISSRESGESMADVWRDMLHQMQFGLTSDYPDSPARPGKEER